MKRKKLLACLLCAATASAAALSGCSSSDTSSTSANSIALSDMTIIGTVESIDGSTIELTVGSTTDFSDFSTDGADASGEMPSGDFSEGEGAEAPDAGAEEGDTSGEDSTDESTGDSADTDSAETTASGGEAQVIPLTDTESTDESTDSTDDSEDGGEAPEEAPDGTDASGEMPSGDFSDSDFSGGDAAGGMSAAMGSVSSVSGTVTLTIGDESVIVDSSDESASLEDIEEGDTLTITIDENGEITAVQIAGSQDSAGTEEETEGSETSSTGDITYTAVLEITEDTDISGETYESTGTDENAIYIYEGASATLDSITVNRTSSDSTGGDNSSFYGVGASILVADGTAVISGSTITSDAAGGAGVFAYNTGVVYVSDTTITTSQDTSGGIHVAGGGTLYAWDLTVETSGESSAAIRSDRGGGTMVVDGGTYTSNGIGSPAVYCTADITVNGATLTANAAEGVCIEGLNSLRLYDCDLTASMADDDQNDCTWSVILYQSMSGDSEVGTSVYEMIGGSITSSNGGLFYTTNTESVFLISDVEITAADDCEFFLKVTGNANERGWGTSGSNGAQCTFTADTQEMAGDVIWDSISTLDFYMQNGSTLTGALVNDESNAGSGGSGYCNLYISSDSTWVVTGDSILTALYCEGTILDESGNTVTVAGSDGTVYVEGTSSYTITVDTYSDSADFSGASEVSSFSDYEVEQP